MRKFEVCKKYNNEDVILPKRSTKLSAGYDLFAVEDVEIPPLWKQIMNAGKYKDTALNSKRPFAKVLEKVGSMVKPTIVKTGVKIHLNDDEYLAIVNRSSNPLKKFLLVANGMGVVDSDYVNNPDNDGEIGVIFWNLGVFNMKVKKGDKIAQGIIHKFYLVENDIVENEDRTGGFGSTGNK